MTTLPLWLKLAYTAFLAVIVPAYWRRNGLANFLWFSDVALLGTGAALWLESAMIASMMAVGVLLPELFWNLSFLSRLLVRVRITSVTDYMFDARKSRFMRGLSLLLHVVMPVVLVVMLIRLGYDDRALPAQTVLAWVVLPVTWLVSTREKNINYVFGFGSVPQRRMHPLAYLAVLMLFVAVVIYVPTHFLLRAVFR